MERPAFLRAACILHSVLLFLVPLAAAGNGPLSDSPFVLLRMFLSEGGIGSLFVAILLVAVTVKATRWTLRGNLDAGTILARATAAGAMSGLAVLVLAPVALAFSGGFQVFQFLPVALLYGSIPAAIAGAAVGLVLGILDAIAVRLVAIEPRPVT